MLRVFAPRRESTTAIAWWIALLMAALVVLTFVRVRSLGSVKAETPSSPAARTVDPSAALTETLRLHREEFFDDAALEWKAARLPAESEIWRHLALCNIYLVQGDLAAAEKEVKLAAVKPGNAVVHYQTALLRLEQSAKAADWPDASAPEQPSKAPVRLISVPNVAPNTRVMLRRTAAEELEKAIAQAERVDLEQALIPEDWTATPACRPTVGELLVAMRAEKFVGRSHATLGHLLLESNQLQRAETHFDQATRMDAETLRGYSDLAQLYAAEGRHLDAARADLKATTRNFPAVRVIANAVDQVNDGLRGLRR